MNHSQYRAAYAYLDAKLTVLRAGYFDEITWQNTRDLAKLSERMFLRETAWVILSAGISEVVIRSKFKAISTAFYEWQSAPKIVSNRETCVQNALEVFGNRRKITAIANAAEHVTAVGFSAVRAALIEYGVSSLKQIPGLGPVTSIHLGKNVGVNVAKPDRHLVRVAELFGYRDPMSFCDDIARLTDDRVNVIDAVWWRYCTINTDYRHILSQSRALTRKAIHARPV